MTIQATLSVDDCQALASQLIARRQSRGQLGQLMGKAIGTSDALIWLANDGTATVSDALVSDVQAIMAQPNWKQLGKTENLLVYADVIRRDREIRPLAMGGFSIAMDRANRTENLSLCASGAKMVLVNLVGHGVASVDAAQLQKAITDRLMACRDAQNKVNMAIQQGRVNSKNDVEAQFNQALP
jgi:hypothetical protein